jgi:uncharacterized damage-inducible protein DinB
MTERFPTPKEQLERFRAAEFATTMRVLRAFPEDRLDMRPAAKSKTARDMAVTFVAEEHICRAALRGGDPYGDFPPAWPEDFEELLRLFESVHAETQAMLERAGDAELGAPLDFLGRRVTPLDVLWLELLDQIHHRGQFSIYLRLADAKVPSIYGPTADDPTFELPAQFARPLDS